MTIHRFILGIKSLGRLVELWHCLRQSYAPCREILAFLQIKALHYPYRLKLRSGVQIDLKDWEDLTTAWVVFYGDEYTLKHGDQVIVDLGANIGAFSLLAASKLPEAQIVALEPFPSNFKRFQDAIVLNHLESSIQPIQAAAVGESGVVRMDDADDIPSHSRKVGASNGIEVEGLTLEAIMQRQALDEIDFLKVDIEGAEYALFEKTPNKILEKVKRIGLEYHSNGCKDALFTRLADAGFQVGRYPKKGSSGVVEFIRI